MHIIFRYIVKLIKKTLRDRIAKNENEFESICKRVQEIRRNEEIAIIRGASIVALTTTGAAKYNYLLQVNA